MKIGAPPAVPYDPSKKEFIWTPDGIANMVPVGFTATQSVLGTNTAFTDANGRQFNNYLTAAVNPSDGGVSHTGAKVFPFSVGQKIYWHMRTGPAAGDITTVRIWFLLGALNSGAPAALDDFNDQCVGFRFSTAAADVNWMCCSNNGSAGCNFTSSGVAVAANTEYKLSIDLSTVGTAIFSINGAPVLTSSTKIPTTTSQGCQYFNIRTLAAAAVNVRIGRSYIQAL